MPPCLYHNPGPSASAFLSHLATAASSPASY